MTPATLRPLARQARHLGMPTIADALDAAAERIEGLEMMLRDAADDARSFPANTCATSRHVHEIADALAEGRAHPMLDEEPEFCAASLHAVLASLWTAREALREVGR